ncbi:MAG: NfeD family protein [Pirellulaceae bacterium]
MDRQSNGIPKRLNAATLLILALGAATLWPMTAFCQNAAVPSKLQERAAEYKKPVVIVFDGIIDYRMTSYFRNRLNRAKSYGADLVILQIDSPGGLAMQSLAIAEALRDVDWAYTVAYVPREAISGAALMSLGCDEIVLGSQARFGDAGPIYLDPELAAFRYVPAKAKSVLVRQAQDLAAAKERSAELAEAMIDENALVFMRKQPPNAAGAKPDFRTVHLANENQNAQQAARDAGLDLSQWELVPETAPEKFFTVNGPRAVQLGFGNFVADSRGEVAKELNSTAQIREYDYTLTDGVVYWLNSPIVTGLLILIGLIALYFELSAPGIGAGGLIAGLCAVLFFWSRFFGGTSGWLEVILFLAGIVFLMMELFVIPGFGLAGFAGLVLLFVSVVMASQDFVVPETQMQWNQLLRTLLVILAATCVFIIGAAFISRRFGSIPILSRLSLDPPSSESVDTVDKVTGKPMAAIHPDVSVGDWGVADSLLRPAGRAIFGNRSLDVVSDGAFIEPGTQIRVVEISGNRIVVAEVENSEETTYRENPPEQQV